MEDQGSVKATQPWWLQWLFFFGGFGCDWYSASKWYVGKYLLLSGPVLRMTVLTVGLSLSVALVLFRISGAKWREFAAGFFVVSFALLGHTLLWSTHLKNK